MKVLLTSHGSTGDIYPVIALGAALLKAGHEVRFAAPSLFQESIERAGLQYIFVPPDWKREDFAACMSDLNKSNNPLVQLQKIYLSALPHLEETVTIIQAHAKEVDLLIGSYLFPSFYSIAKKCNIPFAVITFAHNVVPTDHTTPEQWPNFSFLPKSLHKRWTKLVWRISDLIVDYSLHSIFKKFVARGIIEKHYGFFTKPAPLSLVAVSPALMQKQDMSGSPFVFTGYLRWQSKESPKLEDTLKTFCAGQKVPVLNFGSVAFENAATLMNRFQKNWPADKKIIIQSGWAELAVTENTPNILLIGKVSHDQLFAHASCVIHHGGAGTTASVLHAGCPHIIVPHIADQDFFASEIRRLGAGYSISKKVWPEQILPFVKKIEQNTTMQARAKELAQILYQEDGPATAVRTLEEYQQHFHR